MNLRVSIAKFLMKKLTTTHAGADLGPGAGAATRVEDLDGRGLDVISRGEDVEMLYAAAPYSPVYAFSLSVDSAFKLGVFFLKLWWRHAAALLVWRWARGVCVDEEQRVAFEKWRKAKSRVSSDAA